MTEASVIENIVAKPQNPETQAGEMFAKFAEIQRYLFENNTYLYLHGTRSEVIKNVFEQGLRYKIPDITATAVNMTAEELTNDAIDKIKNWPHYELKHLIMVGIPFNARVYKGNPQAEPIWRPTKKGDIYDDGSTCNQDCFLIPKELVVGSIDVDKSSIVINPRYGADYNKAGLQIDNGINPIGYNGSYIPELEIGYTDSSQDVNPNSPTKENEKTVTEKYVPNDQVTDIDHIDFNAEDW